MMSMGVGHMRYLGLAREDMTTQVEGLALRHKMIVTICWFLIQDVIFRYGCMGKIMADSGELDAHEVTKLFNRLWVKISLMMAYYLEANGKVEREHKPIVKVIISSRKLFTTPIVCVVGRPNYT